MKCYHAAHTPGPVPSERHPCWQGRCRQLQTSHAPSVCTRALFSLSFGPKLCNCRRAECGLLQGPRPMIYFCEHGAGAVRLALYTPPVPAKGQKAFPQGAALKADGRRPIVALAALPMEDSLLLVLTADGMLTGGAWSVHQWLPLLCRAVSVDCQPMPQLTRAACITLVRQPGHPAGCNCTSQCRRDAGAVGAGTQSV